MDIKKKWFLMSGGGYNAYITAYIARLTALGYTQPSAATLSAMNTFTSAIPSVMAKLDTLYIQALNDVALANAANVNIITPASFLMTRSGTVSQLVSGFQGNAVDGYGDTNYNPATQGVNYLLNSASRLMYIYTVGAGTHLEASSTGATVYNQITFGSSASQRVNSNFTNLTGGTVDMSGAGYKGITRLNSTNLELYNGLTKSSRTATSVSIASYNQQIGRHGTVGYSSHVFSLYGMGGALTEAEHNLVRSSFLTYLTAIGL